MCSLQGLCYPHVAVPFLVICLISHPHSFFITSLGVYNINTQKYTGVYVIIYRYYIHIMYVCVYIYIYILTYTLIIYTYLQVICDNIYTQKGVCSTFWITLRESNQDLGNVIIPSVHA